MELVELVESELQVAKASMPFCTIVAAVSGGADSMALLHLLVQLRVTWSYQLVVAHVHHGIRETATRDAELVRQMAAHYKCTFVLKKVNVPEAAKTSGESVETTARRLRYEQLMEVAATYESPIIATAHHMDDQAETVLDRLLRGTGLQGLAGILPLRKLQGVYVIRPLLQVAKKDLLEYAKQHSLPYEEDETNTLLDYRRNRIRHELIPHLEAYYNPLIVNTLAHEAEIVRAENELMAKLSEDFVALNVKCSHRLARYDQEAFLRLPLALQRRVVKLVLECIDDKLQFGYDEVEAVRLFITRGRGRRTLKGGFQLVIQNASLEVMRDERSEYAPVIRWTPATVDRASFFSIRGLKWLIESSVVEMPSEFSRTLWDAWFSLEDEPELVVRGWQEGDRIKPFGMEGSKLLSDVFIDHKIIREWRRSYPVFAIGKEVVWVPGLVRSRAHLVRKDIPLALRVSVRPAMED